MAKTTLPILLVGGPTSAGKSYLTDRILAIDFAVTTAKLDRILSKALRQADIPPTDGQYGYSLGKEAKKLRQGAYSQETVDRVNEHQWKLVRIHLRRAHEWGVGMIFEGYTLGFADVARMIKRLADEIAGDGTRIVRVTLKPSLGQWNHNRAVRPRRRPRRITDATKELYEKLMMLPEAVPGVEDHIVEGPEDARPIAEQLLRSHKWHQRFTLGPVTTRGPSDSRSKFEVIELADVVGKRVVDLCCATGVIGIMAKDAGAAEVVGIEYNPKHFAKSLELQKVLSRHSTIDPSVDMRLGDVAELLPAAGHFDTAILYGALHYFSDYHGMLGMIAEATERTAYVEFDFQEGEFDTAHAPDGIHEYERPSGNKIYLGNERTIERVIAEAMPGFVVKARTPVPPPARKKVFRREVWRLRRAPR